MKFIFIASYSDEGFVLVSLKWFLHLIISSKIIPKIYLYVLKRVRGLGFRLSRQRLSTSSRPLMLVLFNVIGILTITSRMLRCINQPQIFCRNRIIPNSVAIFLLRTSFFLYNGASPRTTWIIILDFCDGLLSLLRFQQ